MGVDEYNSRKIKNSALKSPTAEDIKEWLVSKIAELTEIEPQKIGVWEPFTAFGLASMQAVMISGELEEMVGRQLSAALFYDYPSIGALAQHLANHTEEAESGQEVRLEPTEGTDLVSDIIAKLETLSDAEAEALLGKSPLTQQEKNSS